MKLMERLRIMTDVEYQEWLDNAIVIWKTKPTLEDLYQREKIRKQRLDEFRFSQIHSDGLEEWRKKHNQS
jgi:hypothetical protein